MGIQYSKQERVMYVQISQKYFLFAKMLASISNIILIMRICVWAFFMGGGGHTTFLARFSRIRNACPNPAGPENLAQRALKVPPSARKCLFFYASIVFILFSFSFCTRMWTASNESGPPPRGWGRFNLAWSIFENTSLYHIVGYEVENISQFLLGYVAHCKQKISLKLY